MKYNYDSKFDVLYIELTDNSNSYGDDSNDGFVLMKDIDTDEVTGVTIMNFNKTIGNTIKQTLQ